VARHQLGDSMRDPAPSRHTVIVAGGRELIHTRGAFLERLVSVALQHELRRSPNVDLGYHASKAARPPSIKV
jgi:hypothetical protein